MVLVAGSKMGFSSMFCTFPKQELWKSWRNTNCGEMPVTRSCLSLDALLMLPLRPKSRRKSEEEDDGSLANRRGLGPEIVCALSRRPCCWAVLALDPPMAERGFTPSGAPEAGVEGVGGVPECSRLRSGDEVPGVDGSRGVEIFSRSSSGLVAPPACRLVLRLRRFIVAARSRGAGSSSSNIGSQLCLFPP